MSVFLALAAGVVAWGLICTAGGLIDGRTTLDEFMRLWAYVIVGIALASLVVVVTRAL